MKPAFDIQAVAEIRSRVNLLELITPINYRAEKQKWLENGRKFFNPQFIYDDDAIRETIQRIRTVTPLKELLASGEYDDVFGGFRYLACDSLQKRLEELSHLATFLETVVDRDTVPGDDQSEPLHWLYGSFGLDDVAFAEQIIACSKEEAYANRFTLHEKTTLGDARDYKKFYDVVLGKLRGMFSEKDKAKLQNMKFDANGIAKYFRLTLDYMRRNAVYSEAMNREENLSPSYQVRISPNSSAITVSAFTIDGRSSIMIPIDCEVDGLKLIELIAHELNAHYRSAMSTRAYFRDLLDPRDNRHPMVPLIPMMSHSLNESLSEGLAKLNDIRVSGEKGFPRPYQILAINFAKKSHNFEETMEYIFELSRLNHESENQALINAWNYAYRIFRGQRDTSSRCGYAFPKDKIYLCGFTSVVQNSIKWHDSDHHFQDFTDLLRYSTLTLEELEEIDLVQSFIDQEVDQSPYPDWKYGKFKHGYRHVSKPDPVEYVAGLLLN